MRLKLKVSVISPSLNTGKFLRETIESIRKQSLKNFEYIVVDGGSTDGTIDILKKYSGLLNLKWVSKRDSGILEAVSKGLSMAKGDYILFSSISDGYLDRDWFQKCVDVLDRDKEVSLVWGFVRQITEDGELKDISFPQFHNRMPPQKTEFIYYWLATFFPLPEMNFCVRRNVFDACFPLYEKGKKLEIDPIIEFNYHFNAKGYLPYFIPTVASFSRIHSGQLSEKYHREREDILYARNFLKLASRYRKDIILGLKPHHWRDGEGNILPIKFSRSKFFREQVFSAKGFLRILLCGGAALVRPTVRWLLAEERVPRPLKTFIKKLKYFYGYRQ